MALYSIRAEILVNVDDDKFGTDHQEATVTDGLNEMFRDAEAGPDHFIVDWGYPNRPVARRRDDLDLATYEEGEFQGV